MLNSKRRRRKKKRHCKTHQRDCAEAQAMTCFSSTHAHLRTAWFPNMCVMACLNKESKKWETESTNEACSRKLYTPPLLSFVLPRHAVHTLRHHHHHHHHHQSQLTARVVGAPQDDFTTSFLHFPPFSTALWDLLNARPSVQFLKFSSLRQEWGKGHVAFTVQLSYSSRVRFKN